MQERFADIPTQDGKMDTFIVHSTENGPCPAVVAYFDIWGMREELFDIARRLAAIGYTVMVPNLYYRQGKVQRQFFNAQGRSVSFEALDDDLKKIALGPASKTPDALVMQDTASLIDFAQRDDAVRKGPMGCFGYCLGGRLVLRAAGNFPAHFKASASLHGSDIVTDAPDSPHLVAAKAEGEIYSGFGELDWFSPPPVIATMVETFRNRAFNYRHTVHQGVRHGYALPDRDVHNKQATLTDWENIYAMFRRQLG